MTINDIVSDLTLIQALEISKQTREQAIVLLDLMIAQASSVAPSPETQLQVSKQQKALVTCLAQLRAFHRDAQISVKETKGLTTEARQEVDKLHLQLQNLYYEQRHLLGEITACESYEYAISDNINCCSCANYFTQSQIPAAPSHSSRGVYGATSRTRGCR